MKGFSMPILFASTLFLSAALLFLLQPMVAKMLLPKFGGAPAVWNTCMAFYQTALLLGYVYAHAATTWLGLRRQAAVHLGVLLLPVLALPIAVPASWVPPAEANPVPWLLGLLLVSVGLPFFVVASTAPLLQKWFTATGHPSAQDPYYLYAASNLGSLLALLGYPFLVEPRWRLQHQSWLWTGAYGVLVILLAACALRVWRSPPSAAKPASTDPPAPAPSAAGGMPGVSNWTRLRWVALAVVPSSWMLGVTSYLSTDVSPFPLLWIVPLALYLLTFILVFSRLPAWVHTVLCWTLPVAVLVQTFLMTTSLTGKLGVVVPLHLLTFFVAAMVCHGELARSRPPTQYLTEFYLWLSVGGVVGGLFNALVAPLLFRSVAEYPLALVLACLLMRPLRPERHRPWSRFLDFALPLLLGLFTLRLLFQWEDASSLPFLKWLGGHIQGAEATSGLGGNEPQVGTLRLLWQWGPPTAICLVFFSRPIRFGLGVGALFLASGLYTLHGARYVLQERNFFGVLRVESANEGHVAKLSHGVTMHGAQFRSQDRGVRLRPLLYYFRTGPIGQVFQDLQARGSRLPVGVIGLGAGTLAAYAQPNQEFVFFEIDPAVKRIAWDPNYFTYLAECAGRPRVVLGDARLSLAGEPDGHYGLLVVDAFSSDAVPVHLITQEALQLYLKKLADGGLLAFHISSKYLDLEPVMSNLARAEDLHCLVQHDGLSPTDEEVGRGKFPSDWVVMARHQKDFGNLANDRRWSPAVAQPGQAVWTDDFSNVLRVVQWWQ
jgi:hypothetical protein